MSSSTTGIHLVEPPRRRKLVGDAVFGMALFVFTEIMLFTGFISAFNISKSSAVSGSWPPPGQPRLPAASTAINTIALLISGVFLLLAYRAYKNRGPRAAVAPMGVSILLGTFFVAFQGFEWASLLSQGLTLFSSPMGAFFYLIVGAHALHAVAAIGALIYYWFALRRNRLAGSTLATVALFWYFVVLMWPIIYWQVYL